MTDPLFVVTISHQLGSGGAVLGQKMSEHLDIPFFDREILRQVAEDLHLAEVELENREERLSTFWETFMRNAVMGDPASMMAVGHLEPSDQELYDQECETIRKIAEKRSGVFLGRCGFHILADHPRRVNILIYADLAERVERVRSLYRVDEDAAVKLIQHNDRARAAYVHAFTHQDWQDAHLYDLAMNTSSLGMETTLAFALDCIAQKIGVLTAHPA